MWHSFTVGQQSGICHSLWDIITESVNVGNCQLGSFIWNFHADNISFSDSLKPSPAPLTPEGLRQGEDGYYYKFHEEKKDWHAAQCSCRGEGGNLAIIYDQQTSDVVRCFMDKGWIGVTDQWDEGKWQTPTHGNIPYSFWSAGEPNNFRGQQDCAYQQSNTRWIDAKCGSQLPFICQFTSGTVVQ